MVDKLKMSWPGVAITLGLMAMATGMLAMGHEDYAGLVLMTLLGQVLPPPVSKYDGVE